MHLASITALVVVVALGPAPAAAQHARSPDDCLCKHVADCLCSHEGLTCRSLEQRRCWTGTRDITCSPGEDPSHRARIRVIGCPAPRTPMTIALELCLFGVQVGAMLYAAATYHRRVERGDYLQPDDPNRIVDADHLVRLRGNASGTPSSLERILRVHLACSWMVGLIPIFGCISGVPVVLLCYLVYLPAYRTRSYAGLWTYLIFQVIGVAFWITVLWVYVDYSRRWMERSVVQEYLLRSINPSTSASGTDWFCELMWANLLSGVGMKTVFWCSLDAPASSMFWSAPLAPDTP